MSPKSKEQFKQAREESKERIIDSALKLFSDKGFFNTSIRQIAKKAEISNGLLYNYFSSKEELLVEIVNKSFKIFENTTKVETSLNARKRIELTINKMFDLIERNPPIIKMMMQISLKTGKFEFVNKLINNKYSSERNKLAFIFEKLGYKDGKTEASIFLATLDGILIQSMIMKDSIPLEKMRINLINKYAK